MSADPDCLRIGLVGAGMVSQHHLSAWGKVPAAEVVAIADPDAGRARDRAREFGVQSVYSSAEELIAEASPDALDIAAPVDRHGDLCRLAADRGIAILCQKPLAGTAEEAEAIVAGVGDRVRFMVHENWRFRKSYRQIGTWLANGLIGEVETVRMSVRSSGMLPDDQSRIPALERQPFLADLERLLVFEVLIHHIDVLRWLFGELSVSTAYLSQTSDAVRGEDTGTIIFAGSRGETVILEGCLAEAGAPLRISDHAEIIGSKGTIKLADTTVSVEGTENDFLGWGFDEIYASAFEGAMAEFVAGLAEQRAFETEAADNLEVLRLVRDVYAAAEA